MAKLCSELSIHAIVWSNHHYLMRYAAEATPRLLWYNFAHLFSMSLLPLSTAWMAVSELAPQPVAFYAAVFFLVNVTYICLIWELIDRTPVDEVSPRVRGTHALPVDHDFMPLRDGCGCSAEIPTYWSRNMYLLPRRLSETRSAGSWEANISRIKRTICIPADLPYPSSGSGKMRKRIQVGSPSG
jgi:Endosomal/lysosomal potassium channel TMEM175